MPPTTAMTAALFLLAILTIGCTNQPEGSKLMPPEEPPMEEPHMPFPVEQWSPDAGAEMERIYARAEEIVLAVESVATSADLEAPAEWPEHLDALARAATRLGRECFHDGALGPGTAMLNPTPYIERIRKAFRFEASSHALPERPSEQLQLAAALGRRVGLTLIVARIPGSWAEAQSPDAIDELVRAVEEKLPKLLEMEILVDVGGGVDKWVGQALPRMRADGRTLTIEGPPAFQEMAASVLGGP